MLPDFTKKSGRFKTDDHRLAPTVFVAGLAMFVLSMFGAEMPGGFSGWTVLAYFVIAILVADIRDAVVKK